MRSAAWLHHRNILGVLYSQANKLPHFLVTSAVGDITLASRLAAGDGSGGPSFGDSVRCAIQLANTLAYAHRQGCVHGRLCPSEIRFDSEGQPMLSGFRTLKHCGATPSAAETKLGLDEFIYASPEYRRSGTCDAKSDQYLLGLVVYEMISGAPPVRVSTWASLLDPDTAELLLHPRPLRDVADGCDQRVSDVVTRMLSVDPESRWDSLEDVARELEDSLSNTTCVEAATDSYRRCARDDRFYQVLYDHLFDALPEIRGMFATRPQGDPTILSGIARTHAHYQPRQFDMFRDAVLAAVATCDSRAPHAVEAWRGALAPGIDYLKSKAGALP